MNAEQLLRWGLHQVRHGLYSPLELAYELGMPVPRWLVLAIVAIDKPILAVLIPRPR